MGRLLHDQLEHLLRSTKNDVGNHMMTNYRHQYHHNHCHYHRNFSLFPVLPSQTMHAVHTTIMVFQTLTVLSLRKLLSLLMTHGMEILAKLGKQTSMLVSMVMTMFVVVLVTIIGHHVVSNVIFRGSQQMLKLIMQ
jgi:hypothetical protein